MIRFIHEREDWPRFRYDASALLGAVEAVAVRRGRLFGRLDALGFDERRRAELEAGVDEAVGTSAIEGESLDLAGVRSSVARHLGMADDGPSDRRTEGLTAMMADAVGGADRPLDADRLLLWHRGLFPDARGPFGPIAAGRWRDDALGPMQVVGRSGGERAVVHFEAPAAERVPSEVASFLAWFEVNPAARSTLGAGLAHLWFLTIHPLEDGNGRLARALLEMALARADGRRRRSYSVSAQILAERAAYYRELEAAQRGDLDVTAWLAWYLACLERAVAAAETRVDGAIARGRFWTAFADATFNARQRRVLNLAVGGELRGRLTNRQWKRITGASDATAGRDLEDLVARGVLVRHGAGRSVAYELSPLAAPAAEPAAESADRADPI